MATPVSTKQKSNNSLTTSVLLSEKQQMKVQEQLKHNFSHFPWQEMRSRFMLLDLAYYMEKAPANTNTDAPQLITALYQDLELPVLQPNIDAAHAYLAEMFTSGTPMFAVASDEVSEERQEAASQIEAVIWENSHTTQWKRNTILFLLDAVKYNLGVMNVEWATRRTFKPTTDLSKALFSGNTEEIFRSGNELKHWDMYNTFWDISTKPGDICTRGDYIGKVERLTFTQCWQFIADLKMNSGQVMNVQSEEFWKSSPREVRYHVPQVMNPQTVNEGTDWSSFFFQNAMNSWISRNMPTFEVVTWYQRIIPKYLDITNVPDSGNVQIWKFIEINGRLVYAQRMTNAHDMLPAVLAQSKEDGLGIQTKGSGDLLMPFQNLSSTLWRARIASLARSLSDRAIFDPSKISEKHINSAHPLAKIPVRPSGYGKKISDSYYSIPFNDLSGQIIGSEIERVQGFASDAAHINRSRRGQFTKGNRTLTEYQDVMDNSDSSQQLMATLLEDQAFMPIKRQVLTNILQYQDIKELIDPVTQQPVEINPVTLRQATLEFKIADGLNPKSKLLGTQATLESIGLLAQIDGANQEYDILRMSVDAVSQNGSKVKKYKRAQQFVPISNNQQTAQQGQAATGQPPAPGAQVPVA